MKLTGFSHMRRRVLLDHGDTVHHVFCNDKYKDSILYLSVVARHSPSGHSAYKTMMWNEHAC